jgi:hypothetical protein
MPHHDIVALSGVVMNVFAHRFTIKADGKVHLADLGPKGAEAFPLNEGLALALKGERRPSEIKVIEISAPGRKPVLIEHKKPHHRPGHHPDHHHHREADPNLALRAAEAAGWIAKGEPHRKPEHFEVLARKGKGPWAELHVDLDGGLYKTKALPPDGGKWADLIA